MSSTQTVRSASASERRASFAPSAPAYGVACRLFPGFALLPTSVLVSLEPYAELFDPKAGPLTWIEREAIAAAVSEAVAEGTSHRGEAVETQHEDPHTALLASFTVKLSGDLLAIDHRDLARFEDAGLTEEEMLFGAETAIGYRVIARLSSAARRPAGTRRQVHETSDEARAA